MISIALTKGRLEKQTVKMLEQSGFYMIDAKIEEISNRFN